MTLMRISKTQKSNFRKLIFSWWKSKRRNLPWRHTNDPYKILVSEVMLQQTQVTRVLPKYEEFLNTFPDVFSLATSRTAQVLQIWKGLGYNRRALYLKKAAEAVVNLYSGKFPNKEEDLRNLPGVGKYTARALLVFAYKYDISMIDTNIRQIIVTFFFQGKPQKEKDIESVADQLVPKGKSWDWHQALMDYGALELVRSKQPKRVRQSKNITPFKDTKRFIRGKILDTLRVSPIDESKLVEELAYRYHKEATWVLSVIRDLERDGLVELHEPLIQLPE